MAKMSLLQALTRKATNYTNSNEQFDVNFIVGRSRPNTKYFCYVFRLNVHCVEQRYGLYYKCIRQTSIFVGAVCDRRYTNECVRVCTCERARITHFDHMNQTTMTRAYTNWRLRQKKRATQKNTKPQLAVPRHNQTYTKHTVSHINFVLFCCLFAWFSVFLSCVWLGV